MIERVAKSIYERMEYDGPPNTAKPEWVPRGNSFKQDDARRYARAAIAAMREPTWEQRQAFTRWWLEQWVRGPTQTPTVEEMDDAWRAMIDAALSDEQREYRKTA